MSGERRRLGLSGAVASRLAPLTVLLAAFVLGGCGIGSNPEQTVVTAARTTLAQSLFSRLTFGAGIAGAPSARVVGEGASVFASGLGFARIDFTAAAGKPAVEYLDLLPGTVDLMPPSVAAAGLPPGKTWVAVPLTRSGPVDAAFPRLAVQLESVNAELLLDELAWGATAASHVGEPVINHQPLSEYVVTVTLSRAAAAAAGASAAAMRAAIVEELAALRAGRPGATSVRIRVWVDGPGRVAQLEAALPGSGLGTVSISFSQYGVQISPNPPLAAQVVGLAALLRPGARLPVSPLALGLR